MIRYFNRTNQSLSVALNDGGSGFVVSKGILSVKPSQVSADIMVKVKKKMLVRMEKISEDPSHSRVVSVISPKEAAAVVEVPQEVLPTEVAATASGPKGSSDLDVFLDEYGGSPHE